MLSEAKDLSVCEILRFAQDRNLGVGVKSHYVTADSGLTLHVVEYDSEGPPLLAVHGTGLVAQVWGVMAPHLAPHVRLRALDRKGHGESDKPAEGYEPETAIEEYAAVIRQFGGEGWIAMGHSSGGTSLALAAARHPALFRALILVDPIIYPARRAPATEAETANTFVERTRDRRDHWPSAHAMFDDLATKRAYRTWQPEALWDYVRYGAETGEDGSVRLKCPPELEARIYGSSSSLDLFDEVARIEIPTLVIRGGASDRFPRGNAERMAASNPRIRLVEMPGLTHFAAMEDPEGVARLCIEFLRDA